MDLLRFYGVDLADFYRGELSPRRLSVLLHHLPADSATHVALTDTPAAWSLQSFLLADVYAALTGEQHPARPKPKSSRYADLRERLERQRARQTSQPPPAPPSREGSAGASSFPPEEAP